MEKEKLRQKDDMEDLDDALHAYNWIHILTLQFADGELERAFHAQMDRWFIPALAIAILFLIIYGIYQVKNRLLKALNFLYCNFRHWLCHAYL